MTAGAGRAHGATARALVVALLASVAAAAHSAPADGELDRLVRLFDAVVFGSEIEGAAPAERVRKWSGEVRWKVGGAAAARPMAARHAAALARLTGLVFRELPGGEKGETLVVMAVPRAKMAETARLFVKDEAVLARLLEDARGNCFFLSFSSGDRIAYAAVIANAELSKERLERCLLEEMTQVLGLPNDDDGLKRPVPGLASLGTGLTAAGELLVRTLYDRRVAAGMARAEALAAARAVMAEILGGAS